MTGTLTYRKGNFIHDPNADVSKLRMAEDQRQSALKDDTAFDRNTGYVCRKKALNGMPHSAADVPRTNRYVLVSFGNDGLAWASVADLKAQLPLSETAEWEPVNDVTVRPAVNPNGNLWVGRENPSRLVIFSKEKTTEIAGAFGGERETAPSISISLGAPGSPGGTGLSQET